jgi:hypothetical protein
LHCSDIETLVIVNNGKVMGGKYIKENGWQAKSSTQPPTPLTPALLPSSTSFYTSSSTMLGPDFPMGNTEQPATPSPSNPLDTTTPTNPKRKLKALSSAGKDPKVARGEGVEDVAKALEKQKMAKRVSVLTCQRMC